MNGKQEQIHVYSETQQIHQRTCTSINKVQNSNNMSTFTDQQKFLNKCNDTCKQSPKGSDNRSKTIHVDANHGNRTMEFFQNRTKT